MPIAKFINAVDIQRYFKEAGHPMGYVRALKIKKDLKAQHPNVMLPDEKVIPESWLLEAFGELAYSKAKTKKDTSSPRKQEVSNIKPL